MTDRVLRIGTRDSILATWQARHIAGQLEKLGCKTELIFIKTEGDLVLDTPLPMLGGKGVFTKALDDALLDNRIDLAVHSFKDIPTRLPELLSVAAVTAREDYRDVLVLRYGLDFGSREKMPEALKSVRGVIATSSPRRGAQWLSKYPGYTLTDIRGNIHTRLKKLDSSQWTGAIFAAAGLKRVGLEQHISLELDWMLPAPAQGAMAVMTRDNDKELIEFLQKIHDYDTALCTGAERQLLNELEGGCSAPIGAIAVIRDEKLFLKAAIFSPDGKESFHTETDGPIAEAGDIGRKAARSVLESEKGQKIIRYMRGSV